jgi:hypothetical protein
MFCKYTTQALEFWYLYLGSIYTKDGENKEDIVYKEAKGYIQGTLIA